MLVNLQCSRTTLSLARKGLKVGLMDIDITGPNIPKMLGLEDRILMLKMAKFSPKGPHIE